MDNRRFDKRCLTSRHHQSPGARPRRGSVKKDLGVLEEEDTKAMAEAERKRQEEEARSEVNPVTGEALKPSEIYFNKKKENRRKPKPTLPTDLPELTEE